MINILYSFHLKHHRTQSCVEQTVRPSGAPANQMDEMHGGQNTSAVSLAPPSPMTVAATHAALPSN
jgi:hypothetical protein